MLIASLVCAILPCTPAPGHGLCNDKHCRVQNVGQTFPHLGGFPCSKLIMMTTKHLTYFPAWGGKGKGKREGKGKEKRGKRKGLVPLERTHCSPFKRSASQARCCIPPDQPLPLKWVKFESKLCSRGGRDAWQQAGEGGHLPHAPALARKPPKRRQ